MGFMNEMSGNFDYAQSKHSLSSDTVVDSRIPSARHVPRVSLQSLLYTRALSVRCVAGLCIDCRVAGSSLACACDLPDTAPVKS